MDKRENTALRITSLIHEKKFEAAITRADSYLHSMSQADTDNDSRAYSFETIEEFLFYIARDDLHNDKDKSHRKDIKWLDTQASDVSRMKAYSLIELGRTSEAIDVLRHAIEEHNPIGITLRFELVEAYIANKQLSLAEEELAKLSTMIVTRPYIAKYYRRLGYCMIERKEYEYARILLQYSLCFEKSKNVFGELVYLDDLLGKPWSPENAQIKWNKLTSTSSLLQYRKSAQYRNLSFIPTDAQAYCMALLMDACDKAGDTAGMKKLEDTIALWDEITDAARLQ